MQVHSAYSRERNSLVVWMKNRGHSFVLHYRPGRHREAFQQIGRWVGNPHLPLDWRDAVPMVRRIRQLREEFERLCRQRA